MSKDVAGVNKDLKAGVRRLDLRDRLVYNTHWEEAAWHLGVCIGVFPPDDDFATFRAKVGQSWTATPLGNALYDSLDLLATAGVLAKHKSDGDYEFRWV
jgi:hypothetical protein